VCSARLQLDGFLRSQLVDVATRTEVAPDGFVHVEFKNLSTLTTNIPSHGSPKTCLGSTSRVRGCLESDPRVHADTETHTIAAAACVRASVTRPAAGHAMLARCSDLARHAMEHDAPAGQNRCLADLPKERRSEHSFVSSCAG